MAKTIQQSVTFIGVSPEDLFNIYLDSHKHAAAIGAPAVMSREVGGEFRAFGRDGLTGRNLHIVPHRMIVQSWRGNVWEKDDLDSILVLTFEKVTGGAQIHLIHANIPDHAFDVVNRNAWKTMYWKPWRDYLDLRIVRSPDAGRITKNTRRDKS